MTKFITIEREYGSGGREVARRLAEETGLACYGREVLEKAAQSLNIPVSELEKYEEKTTNSLLYSIAMLGSAQSADPDMLLREGHLYIAEQMAIRRLAAQGSAVFLGRCACEALSGLPGVIRVFIKSDLAHRRSRVIGEYGTPADKADSVIRRNDRRRAGYYQVSTSKKWRDFDNYDAVLDTSALGVEGCVAALKGMISVK